jgi:hypothetical protein
MMKIEGFGSASGSESISQRHGSADPDPHQNVMDPQHWLVVVVFELLNNCFYLTVYFLLFHLPFQFS